MADMLFQYKNTFNHWRITDTSFDAGIDWCEPNWVMSPYIGEFFNTISIFPTLCHFIAVFINICLLRKYKVIEPRFFVWLGLCFIPSSLGNIAAHASLVNWIGIGDEMILFINQCMFAFIMTNTFNKNKINKLWYYGIFLSCVVWFFILEIIPVAGLIATLFGHVCIGIIQVWFVYKLWSTRAMFKVIRFKRLYAIAWTFYAAASTFAVCDVFLCEFMNYSVLHSIWHVLVGIASHLLLVSVLKIRLFVIQKEGVIEEIPCFPFLLRPSVQNIQKTVQITSTSTSNTGHGENSSESPSFSKSPSITISANSDV